MLTHWLSMVHKTKMLEKKLVEAEKAKQDSCNDLTNVNAKRNNKQKALDHSMKELKKARETIKKLTTSATRLDQVPSISKVVGDKTSLGSMGHGFAKSSTSSTSENEKQSQPKSQVSHFIPTCYFCGKKGHIRPKCFKFQHYLQKFVEKT